MSMCRRFAVVILVALSPAPAFGQWEAGVGGGLARAFSQFTRPVFSSPRGPVRGATGSGGTLTGTLGYRFGGVPLRARLDASWQRVNGLQDLFAWGTGYGASARRDDTFALLGGLDLEGPAIGGTRPYVTASLGGMRTSLQYLYATCPECSQPLPAGVDGAEEDVVRRSGLAAAAGLGARFRVRGQGIALEARVLRMTGRERGATLVPVTARILW